MSFTTAALIVTWLAIVLLAFGYAGLLAQVGELRRAVGDGSGQASQRPGGPVAGLALPASGALGRIRPAGGGVIAFVSPGCPACSDVLADLASGPSVGSVTVVSTGDCAEVPDALGATCLPDSGDLLRKLQVPATPYLLAVDAAGTIIDSLLPIDPHELEHWLDHHAVQKGALP